MEKVLFFYEDIQKFKIHASKIRKLIKSISEDNQFKTGDVNIVFCSDDYLLKMNIKYLKHNFLTDIITFQDSTDTILGGELYISTERVKDNAEKFSESFEEEIIRVIIHGILHLVGMNDRKKEEKDEMTEKENFYLNFYKESLNVT